MEADKDVEGRREALKAEDKDKAERKRSTDDAC